MIDRVTRYFLTPVAAVRPYLTEKALLVLVALDVWCLRLPAAYRYDADEFNLAHFDWLQAVGPKPTAALYIGTLLLVGFLAIAIAAAELGFWWRIVLLLLYSYSWAMSRLDSYQHHYLISWLLLCISLLPRETSAQLKSSTSKQAEPDKPLVCAWAWALLGCLVAVVYFFTSAAKLDAVWQSGACLRQLQGTASLLGPIASAFVAIGFDEGVFWRFVARLTVFVELLLAACYLLPPLRDTSPRKWIGRACIMAWFVAMALHLGFHFAGLKIGWFSAYMITLASIYFLPESWLWPVGSAIAKSIRSLEVRSRGSLLTVIVAGLVATIGWWIDLPGALPASILVSCTLLATLLLPAFQESPARLAISLAVSLPVLWIVIYLGPARPSFYPYRLGQLQRRGQFEKAGQLIPKAEAYVGENDLQGQNILAWFFAAAADASLRNGVKAVSYGTRSCQLCDYANISALDTLACAYATNGDFPQALDTLEKAQRFLRTTRSNALEKQLAEHERLFSRGQAYVEVPDYRYGPLPP